jgi:hypothetical protein
MKAVVVFILISAGLIGCPAVYAGAAIPFEGMVDLHKERLALRFGAGEANAVALDLHRSSPETVTFALDLRHIRLPLFDLATMVQGDITFTGPDASRREAVGEVRGRYTLVNYKPVRDLYLKFALRDRKLIIDRFWTGSLLASGEIELLGEHRSNLSLEIVSSDLERFFGLFQDNSALRVPDVSGIVTGALTLTGPLLKPFVKGHLAAYNGCFKALCYDTILLQLEGTFPRIQLNDSMVTHADGFSFNIAGSVDLSDLAHVPYQVRQLRKVPIIAQGKDRREWVFKRLRDDRDSVTEMKYLWLKDDRGDAEGVLGFEKKIGF